MVLSWYYYDVRHGTSAQRRRVDPVGERFHVIVYGKDLGNYPTGMESGQPASPEMEQMALARLRQRSAHEVRHAMGFAYNFIASTVNHASV